MIELIGVMMIGRIVFNVQIAGSFLLLIVLAVPFIVGTLGLGLLISTVARNQVQAQQITTLTLLPSILLSGYIAPRETLPGPLLLLSNILPVTFLFKLCAELWCGASFCAMSCRACFTCC